MAAGVYGTGKPSQINNKKKWSLYLRPLFWKFCIKTYSDWHVSGHLPIPEQINVNMAMGHPDWLKSISSVHPQPFWSGLHLDNMSEEWHRAEFPNKNSDTFYQNASFYAEWGVDANVFHVCILQRKKLSSCVRRLPKNCLSCLINLCLSSCAKILLSRFI